MGLFKKNKKTKDTNELEFVGEINKENLKNEYTELEFSEDDDEIIIPNKKINDKQQNQEVPENNNKIEEDNQSDLNFQFNHPMLTHYNYILDLESRIRILESEMSTPYPAYAELVTVHNSLLPLLDNKKPGDEN